MKSLYKAFLIHQLFLETQLVLSFTKSQNGTLDGKALLRIMHIIIVKFAYFIRHKHQLT